MPSKTCNDLSRMKNIKRNLIIFENVINGKSFSEVGRNNNLHDTHIYKIVYSIVRLLKNDRYWAGNNILIKQYKIVDIRKNKKIWLESLNNLYRENRL